MTIHYQPSDTLGGRELSSVPNMRVLIASRMATSATFALQNPPEGFPSK
jgi:hypothetical protein